MEINSYNRNRALAVTVIVHVSVLLLMLLSFKGCVNMEDIETPNGGVMVSFGDPNMGGDDQSSTSVSDNVEEPVESNPEPVTSPEDPMVTNEHSDAPTVKKTVKKEEKKPTIDQEHKKRVAEAAERARRAAERAKKNQTSGDGPEDGPGGDSKSEQNGPGGSGKGKTGEGPSFDLSGFSHGNAQAPKNNSQKFGTVKLDFCVDKNGKLVGEPSISPGSKTIDTYLVKISIDALKKVKFKPTGKVKNYNCGTYEVSFKRK